MHTAQIKSASADREGRWAVTGSHDKTVKIWSLADGRLERTIRLPAGPGYVGQAFSVAMSPDGSLIAAGGWMRSILASGQNQIYLFDRASGTLGRWIEGLPENTNCLVFSEDGCRLAAMMGGSSGLRVYAKDRGWDEVARDEDYQGASNGADFAPDGRLATTCFDGKVRLYAARLNGMVRPDIRVDAPGGRRPHRIAFSPLDGTRLAIGYHDAEGVDLFDGRTLATLPRPDATGTEARKLQTVAWSRDGGDVAGGRCPSSTKWCSSARLGRRHWVLATPHRNHGHRHVPDRTPRRRAVGSCGQPNHSTWPRRRARLGARVPNRGL
jgi:WD40 repeat protein